MADLLKRWNGTEWVTVTQVVRMVGDQFIDTPQLLQAQLEGNLNNDIANGVTLLLSGNPITYAAGRVGQSYSATNYNHISTSTNIIQAITGNFTMAVWCKINSTGLAQYPNFRRIMWYADNNRYVGVEVSYNKIVLVGGNVGANTITANANYNDGNWHFLVFRKNGLYLSLLIDDSILMTTQQTTLTGNITLAPILSCNPYSLNGYLDQWRIWDHVIDAAEATELWNNGLGK